MFLINLVDGGADHLVWRVLSRTNTLYEAWQAVMGGVLAAGSPSQALFTSHGNRLAVALRVGCVLRSTFVEFPISALKDTLLRNQEAVCFMRCVLIVRVGCRAIGALKMHALVEFSN